MRLPAAFKIPGLTPGLMEDGKRSTMPRSVVRSVARGGAMLAAVLSSLGLFAGCATDELGPGGGTAVWIGQSVSGRVVHSGTSKAIEGVSVTFLGGLASDALVPLGTATTNASGDYSILRASQTGTPGDFWWFSASGDEPVTVYLALRATKSGFVPVEVRQQVSRTPSSNAPTRVLEAYQLLLSAALRQITEDS
jgi:hypothetical protein